MERNIFCAYSPLWVFFLGGLIVCLLGAGFPLCAEELTGRDVVVLYNNGQTESEQLARKYAELRQVPDSQVLGLSCLGAEEIDYESYLTTIAEPILAAGNKRGWWKCDKKGKVVERSVSVLVTMKGVPLKIKRFSSNKKKEIEEKKAAEKLKGLSAVREASVDSELSALLLGGYPREAMIGNPYYEALQPFKVAKLPTLIVSRIDGETTDICYSLMLDTLRAEEKGLVGWTLVDKGGPHKQGNDWMDEIVAFNDKAGLATLLDDFSETMATNFPLPDNIILYYGWYAGNINGPFLSPSQRFATGAVACHIHSFSAATLRNGKVGWSSGLLNKGAVATVGNVYEPYLHTSHHLDILHKRLRDGFTWGEASSMSVPCLSWQNIAIGDPLYRPFPMGKKVPGVSPQERAFSAWSIALNNWRDSLPVLTQQVELATQRTRLMILPESLGYYAFRKGQYELAQKMFSLARSVAIFDADKLRMELMEVAILRKQRKKEESITQLRRLQTRYGHSAEGKVMEEWIKIVSPPPPALHKNKMK